MCGKTILIVDDEADLLEMLRRYFSKNEYNVLTAENGQQALLKARLNPDLILLDINMPDMDGLTVCEKIRDYIRCPIIFLTARVTESDRIKGLKSGGDDYIVKPFSIKELEARVDAHLRREERKNLIQSRVRFFGDLVIDYSAKEICFNGKKLLFSKKEYDLIEMLSMHPGQMISKEQIFERVWGYDSDSDISVIMAHISFIRAKFAEAGCKQYIQTVWGSGYKWVE